MGYYTTMKKYVKYEQKIAFWSNFTSPNLGRLFSEYHNKNKKDRN